eukprot:TRINITY_DN2656_c0_g1_i3.p4 TRINITY_DN2656_c0_g1~~TRINITY_DN2656_c0_g1_i3.p4  ORF type:complete len:150 (-),score=0.66 TRINITY_DN2656_c0_g1_i3:1072-1521(-)
MEAVMPRRRYRRTVWRPARLSDPRWTSFGLASRPSFSRSSVSSPSCTTTPSYSQGGAWLGYGVRQAGVAAFFALWLVQANLPPPGPNDPPSFWCAADQCASRMPLIIGLLCFSCVAVAVSVCQSWKYVDFGTRLQRARQPNRTAAPYEA